VGLVAYEWSRSASLPLLEREHTDSIPTPHIPATKSELEGFFTHLESSLDARDYWKSIDKKPYMWRNIRTTLTRAQMSGQEVQTWRGILRALMGEG
jgi:tRNA/rRNA methyltransferase